MSDAEHSAERLSCLVDGELHGAELDRAVGEVKGSPEQQQRWSRYHLAVDAMKKSLPVTLVKEDFASRVMQSIESEPTVLAPHSKSSRTSPIRHPLAGLAVAASVTAVVIFGARNYFTAGDTAAPVAQAPQVQSAPVVAAAPAPAANVATVAAEQQAVPDQMQAKLNRYLLNHNQSAIGMHGMLPYARIVGYNNGEAAE